MKYNNALLDNEAQICIGFFNHMDIFSILILYSLVNYALYAISKQIAKI